MSEIDLWVQSSDGGTSGDFADDVLLSGGDARVPTGARAASNFTKVGDGMSESSGIFTFPSTGTWEITTVVGYVGANAGQGYLKNWLSTNSGGAYTVMDLTYFDSSGSRKQSPRVSSVLTISDASTARFRATILNSASHGGLEGGSNPYKTYIRFKKLA